MIVGRVCYFYLLYRLFSPSLALQNHSAFSSLIHSFPSLILIVIQKRPPLMRSNTCSSLFMTQYSYTSTMIKNTEQMPVDLMTAVVLYISPSS